MGAGAGNYRSDGQWVKDDAAVFKVKRDMRTMWLEFETDYGAIKVKRLAEYEMDPLDKQGFLPAWKIRFIGKFDGTLRIGAADAASTNLHTALFQNGRFASVNSEVSSTLLRVITEFGQDLARANLFDEAERTFIEGRLRSQVLMDAQGRAMEHALRRALEHPDISRMSPLEQQDLANQYMEEYAGLATTTLDPAIHPSIQGIVASLIRLLNGVVRKHLDSLRAGTELTFVVSAEQTKALLN